MPAYELLEDIVYPYMRLTSAERKVTTRQREEELARRLSEFFGSAVIGSTGGVTGINGDTVRRYRESRKSGGVSPATVKRELALASKAVNFAITEWDYPVSNPFRGRLISSKDRRAQRPPEPRILTQAESAKLIDACVPWLRDIVAFALHTGLRMAEILDLSWSQLQGDLITFAPEQQKANRHSVCAMGALALEVVARQPHSEMYVFHRDGRRISRWLVRDHWNKARERAGMPDLCFKSLRSTHGQRILDAGHGIEAVANQLRHADIRTTQRHYTKQPVDQMRVAVRGL